MVQPLRGTKNGAGLESYLAYVQSRIALESSICSSDGFIDSSTKRALLSTVLEAELVKRHDAALLDIGFDALLQQANIKDLKILYSLFSRVGSLDLLHDAYQAYILVFFRTLTMCIEGGTRNSKRHSR